MAGIALELAALAFIGYVVMEREKGALPSMPQAPSIPQEHTAAGEETPFSEPMDFITESADEGARYYRAVDDTAELIAGFYSDGRVRFADAQNHRFAGMLQGSHADLLELENNEWSEVFLRVTPTGKMQLELRGGPYDARVLTCETLNT